MKTKILTFFLGLFSFAIMVGLPQEVFAVGETCTYVSGSYTYAGTCKLATSCTSLFKGSSSQCTSQTDICCDAVLQINVEGQSCSYTSGGKTYKDGSCVASSACTGGKTSGTSTDCTKRTTDICCGGTESTSQSGTGSSSGGLVPCGGTGQSTCTLCHLFQLIQNIINWGMRILTAVAFVMLVAAALMYIASAGNSSMMESAKTFIKNTLVGFTIVLLSWVIINAVILVLPINKSYVTGNWWQVSCNTTTESGDGGDDGTGGTGGGGESTVGGLKISPTSVQFTDVELGKESKVGTITIQNTNATCNIPITDVRLSTGSDGFSIKKNNCPTGGSELTDETSCTIDVVYTPTDCSSSKTATLFVDFKEQNTLCVDGNNSIVQSSLTGSCSGGSGGSNGKISFTQATVDVNEDAGTVKLTLKREGGTDETVRVQYSTLQLGTGASFATEGQDYSVSQGEVSWAATDRANKEVSIPILSDSALESKEQFAVQLKVLEGHIDSPAATNVFIVDDDTAGTVGFETTGMAEYEDVGLIKIGVVRSGAVSGNGPLTVKLKANGGSATINNDYAIAPPGEVTWNDGENGRKEFQVAIIQDSVSEGEETAEFSLEPVAPQHVPKLDPNVMILKILEK